MRTVINGAGVDTTQSVLNWLVGGGPLQLATLYLIGEPEDPNAIWLTDWESPLIWSWWGTFFPGTITRGNVSSKFGFEVASLDVSWSPTKAAFIADIQGTSPYQQAYLGKFDGMTFRSWTVYMPTAGDANTFGASELFGGLIGNQTVQRNLIKFTVDSFLSVVNQDVPGPVIENLNVVAGMKGATPPSGLTQVPTFSVTTSVPGTINADCLTPTAGQIFLTNAFQGGFLQFITGSLAGMATAIITNFSVSGPHNQFITFAKFPWNPSPGDQFFASATYPITSAQGGEGLFPFVPDPSYAI
jgi:hypothetical protein